MQRVLLVRSPRYVVGDFKAAVDDHFECACRTKLLLIHTIQYCSLLYFVLVLYLKRRTYVRVLSLQ